MIHYQLQCSQSHGFDGWFKDSATFEIQAKAGLVECPECGDTAVDRALMAPALARRRSLPAIQAETQAETQADTPAEQSAELQAEILPPEPQQKLTAGRMPAQMLAALQKMRAEVEKHCDYVGPDFADEARKMHRGESEHRPIYGETSPEQAESLAEEGIEVAKIPWVPRADG